MTDAEIVAWHRQEAARFRQHVLDGRREAAERRAAGQIDVFGDAYADQESVYEQRHARAADAIEENARLRALLTEAQNQIGGGYCGNCDSFTDCSPDENELSTRIAAALTAPPKEGT